MTAQVRDARLPEEAGQVLALFEAYAASLQIDLAFQDFAGELARVAQIYQPPEGALLVATLDGVIVGGVGLRRFDAGIAELKRLYVRPAGRGHAFGRQLSEAAIVRARALGYEELRLDTLPSMHAAQRLYTALGFRDVAPYRHNPVAGARYLALRLQTA
ncbi:MAG: GNAT family N-acetyltransferase [Pseudoxanthomonas sp.]